MPINRVAQRRTMHPFLLGALLLLSAGWLSAPPSHASVKGEWSDDVSRDLSFSRVLVVGITPDRNQRCQFERAMASVIRSADTAAIVSCDLMPEGTPITRENIEAALATENADAVLATSLISRSWESQEGGTRDTRGNALYKATDTYYGVYGTVVEVDFRTSDPITTVRGKLEVTSKLYETSGATVVYTVDTKIRNVETTSEGILAIIGPISKKLRREGLIR